MYSGLRFLNNIIISLKGHGMLVIMIPSLFNCSEGRAAYFYFRGLGHPRHFLGHWSVPHRPGIPQTLLSAGSHFLSGEKPRLLKLPVMEDCPFPASPLPPN